MVMNITAYDLAQRFIGIKEVPGNQHNPQVLAMLSLDTSWAVEDEIPWCSAFVNYIAWLLRLPRSKSLAARSWLGVGQPIPNPTSASAAFDVVVLSRGPTPQPGPEVLDAPGHVGFFASQDTIKGLIYLLGGNQGDKVSVAAYPARNILGIRRLY